MAGGPLVTAVQVHGLKDLNRALKTIDRRLGKRTQQALKIVASDAADDVKAEFAARFGAIGRKAAKGVRPRARQTRASVVLLGSNPVVRGLEFGANWHWVWGRLVEQDELRRRVYPRWIGNQYRGAQANFGKGYAATKALNDWVQSDKVTRLLAEALDAAIEDVF